MFTLQNEMDPQPAALCRAVTDPTHAGLVLIGALYVGASTAFIEF